jgi:flagellum-specific peptidoglycan hydrolase FlgJ
MMRVARGGSAAEGAQGFYGAAKQYMGGMGGELARFGGTGPGIALGSNLEYAERMAQVEAAARKQGFESVDKFLETEAGKAMLDNGELERQNKLRRDQLGAAQALDSTVKKFGLLNTVTDALSTTFTNVIKKLGGSVAGGVPGAGPAGKPEVPTKTGSFSGNQKEFYDKMYGTLLDKATKAGVADPEAIARLGAAQSALETGYGKHLAGGNNYFGIKARPGEGGAGQKTQEFINGKMVTVNDKFRKYGSMEESAADYIKFLQENRRYKDVLAARSANEAIAAQGRTGYATDPAYESKLKNINSLNSPSGQFGLNGTPSGPASGYRSNLDVAMLRSLDEFRNPANAPVNEYQSESKSTTQLIGKIEELIDINHAML